MTERAARTRAEWVVFAISCAVLLTVAGLIAVQSIGTQEPPAPIASQAGDVRETDGRFYVPVEVVNEGDVTAAEVQITADLTIDGETTSADQVIDFLGGGESRELAFVFDDDPADGELVIRVSGYIAP